jgi:ABC-type glycerol-3-phosphate transport system substrate-binding protein
VRWLPSPALAGITLAGAALLAGCGSDDGASSGQPSTSAPATATSPASPTSTSQSPAKGGTTIEVTIAGGKVTPDPSRKVEVDTGDQVHIRVTSDEADEVHVHGYDIETEVGANSTADIAFVATIPGQFEVEAHELSPPLLFTLVVQ